MVRPTSCLLLCLLAAVALASPIGNKVPVLQVEDPSLLSAYNPEINPDLFEGDILGIKRGSVPKNAVVDESLLWPGGVMVYQVDDPLSALEQRTLDLAIATYEAKTCLRFKLRTNERNYVSVQKTGGGCYSYIGRVGPNQLLTGRQVLSLDPSCYRNGEPGTVEHEFMHAFGFYHEQSRTDRDDYVTINWSNIQPGYEGNFDKYDASVIQSLGATYDYGSVMHYGAYGFAIDPTIPTIIVPDGVSIGQRVGFSDTDLFKLNALYKCNV